MKSIRMGSLMIVLVLAVLTFPASAAGTEQEGGPELQPMINEKDVTSSEGQDVSGGEAKKIVSFQRLPSDIEFQTGIVRSNFAPMLPKALTVRWMEDGQQEEAVVSVTWGSDPAYDPDKAGKYVFTPVLPEEYRVESGASLEIQVTLSKEKTTVSGLDLTMKKKARFKLTDEITVEPAYGRSVQLQMKVKGHWITKKNQTLANAKSDTFTLTYANDWWKTERSHWRLIIEESQEGTAYTSPAVTVSTQRFYQTPGKYFKIKSTIPTRKSGYTLKPGMSGYKVYKVQKRLGCYQGKAKYTAATVKKVKRFQKKKKLKATGRVNKATWLKMGFSEKDWYYMDSYVTPVKVNPTSTKADHINAMVETAKSYVGTRYIWCASAKQKQGVDCAGLVIQCLYAAGIDPLPQGSHVYAYSKNEYTTRKLWASKKFKHVKYSQKKKGDIIVYHNGKGIVNHVSLYIGGGREIEATPGITRYSKAGGRVKGVLRPII
ncbi:MAG: C40 family peptidase [Firmicutes bacterium]|jgi:cell wall-associated NlpC family hydrolase|nr:C40 family peptidase [Bacillota bacterium]